MKTYKTLQITAQNKITTILLNRPDKHNAINEDLIQELNLALNAVEQDKNCHVLVLAGSGKNFCAGADLNWMQKTAGFSAEQNREDALVLARMLQRLASLSKPTIAKIQGKVFGGGLGLIACCDFAICENDSQFCFSEVKLGLSAATISPFVLRKMGYANTVTTFLSAELFDAQEAKRMNLVSQVVSDSELNNASAELTQQLLQNGPEAMRSAKWLAQQLEPVNLDTLNLVADELARVRATDEAKEGIKAFFEKRKADWV